MTARRLAAAMCWAATAAVAARGVSACVNTRASLRWLNHLRPGDPPPDRGRRHVLLILPMLREQSIIADTTAYFRALAEAWGPATVVLATTEREHRDRRAAQRQLRQLADALHHRCTATGLHDRFGRVLPAAELAELADNSGDSTADYRTHVDAVFARMPSTPELAAKLAADGGGVVRHHHHPDVDAIMVHQINSAIDAELRRLASAGVGADHVWIGIYNADSRPHPDTLTALAAAADDTQVVQQSALFTVAGGAPGSAVRMVCDGAALLQSRWSLAREIPRLRAQAAQARGGHARWPRLAHCTGHGLFVRGDCWHRFGGLPTATMNEDLAFGYQLSAAGVPIDVLPLLEVADSPATIRTLVRQHRQWFFSYPGYRDAARLAAAAEHGDRTGRAWLSAQGMARGVLWLGQSPALLATLVLPTVARRRRVASWVSSAALTSYLMAPAVMIITGRPAGAPVRFGPRQAVGLTAAALISSAGPWRCLVDLTMAAFNGDQLIHDKTER